MPQNDFLQTRKLRYNIRSRVRSLETSASSRIRDKVVAELKIDRSTYYKWLKVTNERGSDIPGEALHLFSKIFDVPMELLFNEKIAE